MSATRRTTRGRQSSKRKKPTDDVKKPSLPQGESHIDFLPEDILYKVFKYKHELEFSPSLNIIKKFSHLRPEEALKSRIPLKTLLSPVTNRKLFHIDVEQYEGAI
jgi:hypothetical protein